MLTPYSLQNKWRLSLPVCKVTSCVSTWTCVTLTDVSINHHFFCFGLWHHRAPETPAHESAKNIKQNGESAFYERTQVSSQGFITEFVSPGVDHGAVTPRHIWRRLISSRRRRGHEDLIVQSSVEEKKVPERQLGQGDEGGQRSGVNWTCFSAAAPSELDQWSCWRLQDRPAGGSLRTDKGKYLKITTA